MTKTAINTPIRIVQGAKWPWDIIVVDANGVTILSEQRAAYTTKDADLASVMSCENFEPADRDDAVRQNAEQMAKFEQIVAAINGQA